MSHQITVRIEAHIMYLEPPKDKAEEILRKLADYRVQELGSRLEKEVKSLIEDQLAGNENPLFVTD